VVVRGWLRVALPVAGSITHATPRRSSRPTDSPCPVIPWPAAAASRASATCALPGPWQASQPTLISENVVAYVPAAGS